MKQVKAFVHRHRAGDLIHALDAAGFRRVSLFDVKALLRALSEREQEYSVALGEKVISEVQVEIFCEDDEVDRVAALIQRVGRTGPKDVGWIYISQIDRAISIASDATSESR